MSDKQRIQKPPLYAKSMSGSEQESIISRLVESGLEEKHAQIIIDLASMPPSKASEVGKRVGISRMDAYNSLRKLQERGLVKATLDKPMRFAGMKINEVFSQLIKAREMELRRIQHHLDELQSGQAMAIMAASPDISDDTFSVIKDRFHIMSTLETIFAEAEDEIWLLLGKWGVLHLLRSGAKQALEDAANRGVEIKIAAWLDKKTIRFFDQLDDQIEVRHHEELTLQGAFVDSEVGVQFVHVEENPTGRGKEDTALLIESPNFLQAQQELLKIQWSAGVSYSAARAKIIDGEITEPLQLSLGEGSFYQRLKQNLRESMGSSNAILRREGEQLPSQFNSENSTLSLLGIDMPSVFETVGRRIGQELALKLQNIEDDAEFWNHLVDEWNELGMGRLELKGMPPEAIVIHNGKACGGNPMDAKVFCHMDQGVVQGLLSERHGLEIFHGERVCTSEGQDSCFFEVSGDIDDIVSE